MTPSFSNAGSGNHATVAAEFPAAALPPTDYDAWAANFPGADLADPDGDLDGDGRTNNEERLWGLDPTSASSANPVTVPFDATGTFTYTRRLTGNCFSG